MSSDAVPEVVWRGGPAVELEWLDGRGQVNATYTRPRGGVERFHAAHDGCLQGRRKAGRVTAAAGVEVGQQTACGKTALFMAAHSSRGCIIEKLLCYGASVEKRDMAGVTALMSAVRRRG